MRNGKVRSARRGKRIANRPVPVEPGALDGQRRHWESAFGERAEMFGEAPSDPARRAAELFKREGVAEVLELGAGQGRDTLFFAREGFRVRAVDYSSSGLEAIGEKARASDLYSEVSTTVHDIRYRLPFGDATFDACFSHMLYCMALTSKELDALSSEVRRVLKPGGLSVYTVRHTKDAHYGAGIHRGEDMYEMGGFIVHFFSREKVERLARGFEILGLDEFEEGGLPRRLFRVTLRKSVLEAIGKPGADRSEVSV